jgi:hypothetical protein
LFCWLMTRQQLKSVRWRWLGGFVLSFSVNLEGQISPIWGFETDMPSWCRSHFSGVGILCGSVYGKVFFFFFIY